MDTCASSAYTCNGVGWISKQPHTLVLPLFSQDMIYTAAYTPVSSGAGSKLYYFQCQPCSCTIIIYIRIIIIRIYVNLPTLRTVLLRCPSWGMWDEFLCVFSCSWGWPVVYHTLTQIRKWRNNFCQQFPYPNREKWIASLLYAPLSPSLYFPPSISLISFVSSHLRCLYTDCYQWVVMLCTTNKNTV